MCRLLAPVTVTLSIWLAAASPASAEGVAACPRTGTIIKATDSLGDYITTFRGADSADSSICISVTERPGVALNSARSNEPFMGGSIYRQELHTLQISVKSTRCPCGGAKRNRDRDYVRPDSKSPGHQCARNVNKHSESPGPGQPDYRGTHYKRDHSALCSKRGDQQLILAELL